MRGQSQRDDLPRTCRVGSRSIGSNERMPARNSSSELRHLGQSLAVRTCGKPHLVGIVRRGRRYGVPPALRSLQSAFCIDSMS